jgi:hypothetical protein
MEGGATNEAATSKPGAPLSVSPLASKGRGRAFWPPGVNERPSPFRTGGGSTQSGCRAANSGEVFELIFCLSGGSIRWESR